MLSEKALKRSVYGFVLLWLILGMAVWAHCSVPKEIPNSLGVVITV